MQRTKGYELEYSGLRSELAGIETLKDQLIATVFSISITLIGLAFTIKRYVLLLILSVMVIPFQSLINKKTFMIARIGVYIKLYIEPMIEGMQWETVIHEVDDEFNKKHLKLDRWQMTKRVYKYGTALFSGVALISYIAETVSEIDGYLSVSVLDLLFIIFMTICFAIDVYLCNKGSDFGKIYSSYEDIMVSHQNEHSAQKNTELLEGRCDE